MLPNIIWINDDKQLPKEMLSSLDGIVNDEKKLLQSIKDFVNRAYQEGYQHGYTNGNRDGRIQQIESERLRRFRGN